MPQRLLRQTAAALTGAVLLATPLHTLAADGDAAKLGDELTPVGAKRAGNEEGTIPAWDGGLTEPPDCYDGPGSWYCNPFPDDTPKFTITADNVDEHKDKLSAGQIKMFEQHPETFKMKVYETRRTFANPEWIYEGTKRNAKEASLGGNGEALVDAINGYPFPIPENGKAAMWNHKVRYLGSGVRRWNNQFAVTKGGRYNHVVIQEDVAFPYNTKGKEPEDLDNVIIRFLQQVTEPARLAGTITLVHDTMDQTKEPRRAWQYNPGQRRLRRAPNVGYDNPGTAADGLRTNDQTDTFNGAMDRYTWKLVGKREIYIPYNSYELHSDEYDYEDIILEGHINQDITRYELHRVWVVEANLKPGTTHIYKKRVFYLDEDTWQIALVDIYDSRDQLWRFQEAHTVNYYDFPGIAPIGETIYDVQINRYLAQAFNNEDDETVVMEFQPSYFAPSAVQKQTRR